MSLLLRSSALGRLGGAAAPRANREPAVWTFVLAFLAFEFVFYYAYRYGMSFSQAVDPFCTTRPDGMGLGLTVCRTIIVGHRGKLWAENNADRGASFHFVLPCSVTANI